MAGTRRGADAGHGAGQLSVQVVQVTGPGQVVLCVISDDYCLKSGHQRDLAKYHSKLEEQLTDIDVHAKDVVLDREERVLGAGLPVLTCYTPCSGGFQC